MTSHNSIEAIKAALEPVWKKGHFAMLVLFGSAARGTVGRDSDLDIGYASAVPVDDVALTAEIIRRTHINRVDVVNLRRADPTLAMQIAMKGRALFENPSWAFRDFQSLSMRRFTDTEKLRSAGRKVLDRFQEKR